MVVFVVQMYEWKRVGQKAEKMWADFPTRKESWRLVLMMDVKVRGSRPRYILRLHPMHTC
jgi:hypothetical protein